LNPGVYLTPNPQFWDHKRDLDLVVCIRLMEKVYMYT
jgi:hypothetical protein